MTDENDRKVFFKVVILCLFWYATSSSNNIIGKTLLNEFPYPMSVTMVQLVSITFYSGPVLKYLGVKPRKKDISWPYFRKLIIPLAFGKFLATLFSHVSLWRVPVSYAHTVKATMPLFTVAITRILFGEKQTLKVYCSLIPILVGVGVATITELSFDTYGLLAALGSTLLFSLLTIFSKKVLTDTGMHHLRLLHLLGKLALAMFTPFWLFSDISSLTTDKSWLLRRDPIITYALLFMDGLLNWVQNLLAFSILSLVTPLTYAVANAAKRISVIIVSLLVLGNPVTSTNVFGMCLAIVGVFGYNKSKYDANLEKKKAVGVPLSKVMSATAPQYPSQTFGDLSSERLSHYFPNPLQTAPFEPPYPTSLPGKNISNGFVPESQVELLNNKKYLPPDV